MIAKFMPFLLVLTPLALGPSERSTKALHLQLHTLARIKHKESVINNFNAKESAEEDQKQREMNLLASEREYFSFQWLSNKVYLFNFPRRQLSAPRTLFHERYLHNVFYIFSRWCRALAGGAQCQQIESLHKAFRKLLSLSAWKSFLPKNILNLRLKSRISDTWDVPPSDRNH